MFKGPIFTALNQVNDTTNSSINGPGHKRRPLQIVSQFKCIPGGEQRNSVVVLKQTDVSDELGTFHLQSHSLSRQEWQERTSLPSQCAESFSGQGVGLVLLHYKMLLFKK